MMLDSNQEGRVPKRWVQAQSAEWSFWAGLTGGSLLQACADKPGFLDSLGQAETDAAFDNRDVLEIGVGPLGVSIASFYYRRERVRRLVKIDPLPMLEVCHTQAAKESWARPIVEWAEALAREGEYLQMSAEHSAFKSEFDTVLIYNVLDHVDSPSSVLHAAYGALRPGGRVIAAVDCFSILGRVRFDVLTRRHNRNSILVEAHPQSFVAQSALRLMRRAGFTDCRAIGMPGRLRRIIGNRFRPAYIGRRPVTEGVSG